MLLAVAGFASQAMVRSADSLLPQIAGDFGVTVGAASIVVSAYTIVHGSMQLVSGPVGDRVGKYRMIAIATALCAFLVFACGLASSLPLLLAARIASGMGAAWIIPLGATSSPMAGASRCSGATCRARSSASCSARRPVA